MDRARLETLYREYRELLWNAALQLLGDAAAAEDVLHDVFSRLLDRRAPIEHPRAFLLRAVLNRVRDRLRRSRRLTNTTSDSPEDPGPGPELVAVTGEATARVAALLAALPLEQREVVVLHAFESMSFREIGELCGISPNTAASRWRYGCDRLRSALVREEITP